MTASRSEVFLDIATDLLSRGYRVRFRAAGYSMHPTIRNGEVVIVEPAAAADLKKGDISLYQGGRGISARSRSISPDWRSTIRAI